MATVAVCHQVLECCGVLGVVAIPDPVDEALAYIESAVLAGNGVREDLDTLAVVVGNIFYERLVCGRRRFVLGYGAAPCDVACVLPLYAGEEDLADSRAWAVGSDDEVCGFGRLVPIPVEVLYLDFVPLCIQDVRDRMPVFVAHRTVAWKGSGDFGVFARRTVVVRTEQVVDKVPAGHLHWGRLPVDIIPFLVQVVAVFARDYKRTLGEIVLLEEGLNILPGDEACTLVLQEGRGVAFEDFDRVTEAFEGDAREEAA